jgi:hypothetical protein
MTSAMRCRPVSWIAAALLALPACATRDIYPNPFSGPIAPSNTNVGEMEILLAPLFDTYDAAVNAPWTMPESRYYVFLDGSQWLVDGGNGRSIPVTLYDNYEGSIGFLAAGSHHFQINAVVGGATVFEGDVNIPGGSVTRLYLVGSLDKLEGRFVSYPAWPPAKTLHISAINLVRGGPLIEVVQCAADRCTAASPPLALGESFDADFAADGWGEEYGRYAFGFDSGIGYRPVPTAALPAPPVAVPVPGFSTLQNGEVVRPPNLIAAPIYLSEQGEVISSAYF